MSYYINHEALSAPFMVPSAVVDKHLRLATDVQLKVLLFVLRNISSGIDTVLTAEALAMPQSEVEDALTFWVQCGILGCNEPASPKTPENTEKVIRRAEKPSRLDVAHRGLEDEKIALLLREAQLKLGHNLKSNEASTLVWLYEDEGMEISVILMLLQYAVSEGKRNISFIERTATEWITSGVESVVDAENYIAKTVERKLAWSVVQSAFGIEKRRPSEKELEYSGLWVNEWGMSPEMLRLAYDACIDQKTKLSMPYVAKILEAWHEKGYKKPEDIKKDEQAKPKKSGKKYDYAAYDLDLFEKMLDEN